MGEVTKSVGEGRQLVGLDTNVTTDRIVDGAVTTAKLAAGAVRTAKKTKEEIKAWVADKKRKKGDKLVIADEATTSVCIGRLKKELKIL